MSFFVKSWNGILSFINEKIIKIFATIEFKDIIDIFVLACVFFFVYRFARKRRAIRLIIGVVLFLLTLFVVDAAKMSALYLVFGDFKQIGVVALLIIFQPELRSALEKIGGIRAFDFHAKHTDKEDVSAHYVIESVSRAAQKLSSMGHGALIVIERQNSLVEFKRTGSVVDAVVSPDMLCSIFYKGTALHDGAVIIKDGRIDYAACVLPITNRADIDSELGTRHRAAIGTTEVCDAVVVIVSEETGKISMSIDGELERGFTYTSLKNALEEVLMPKSNNIPKAKARVIRRVKSIRKNDK
jgi:diadenylate cyclase